jgi:hypothetical protein
MIYTKSPIFRSSIFLITTLLVTFFATKTSNAQYFKSQLSDSIQARIDIVDVIFGVRRDSIFKTSDKTDKNVFFSLMPLSGASSEPGLAVSAINASFYLGESKNTNLSNVTFYPTTNFSSYIQFKAIPNLWMSKNSWNIPGKLEFAQFFQDNYGLGANTSKDSFFLLDYNLCRVYVNFNKSIVRNFFIGLGYNLDVFYNIKDLSDSIYYSPYERYEYGNESKIV